MVVAATCVSIVPLHFLSTDRFSRLHGGAFYVLVRLSFLKPGSSSFLCSSLVLLHSSRRSVANQTSCMTDLTTSLYHILIPFHRSAPSWHLTQYTKFSSRILVSLCHPPQIPLIMAVPVYIYTISNWGNPKILGQLVWYVCPVYRSCSHPDLILWNCRSMLVEVLFNVGIISVSTDWPVDSCVFRDRDSPRSLFKGQFISWYLRLLFF